MLGLSSYTLSDKELVEVRNGIFLERGVPPLVRNGFAKSPFSTAWYGKDNMGGYSYELCKVEKDFLCQLFVYIVSGDRWIQVFLNVFDLSPKLESIDQLRGVSGLKYQLPPNSLTRMRLRIDDRERLHLFGRKEYKLKSFSSEIGLKKRVQQLGELIEQDMNTIDIFVDKWFLLHKPNVTNWEGELLDTKSTPVEH